MQQPETKFKNKVRKDLNTLPYCWFFKAQEVSVRGIPDFICCIRGLFIALELKRDKKAKADPLQEYIISQIQGAWGTAWVVSPENWPEVFKRLQLMAQQA